VDDHHLSNITKWKRRKHLAPDLKNWCMQNLAPNSFTGRMGRLNGCNGYKIDFFNFENG
jgi:hypothetical protein